MKAIGDLEGELKNSFPYQLSLAIPMFAIQKGQKWTDIKDAIKSWLLTNSSAVLAGRSSVSISGVPFQVSLDRSDELPPLFSVARWLDPALKIPEQLADNIVAALINKDDQLSRCKKGGNQTLLVLESQDIVLVNRGTIYKAFLVALAEPRSNTSIRSGSLRLSSII